MILYCQNVQNNFSRLNEFSNHSQDQKKNNLVLFDFLICLAIFRLPFYTLQARASPDLVGNANWDRMSTGIDNYLT